MLCCFGVSLGQPLRVLIMGLVPFVLAFLFDLVFQRQRGLN